MAKLLGSPKVQYFKTGTVDYLNGGKLYSYEVGTTTPKNTYPTLTDALAGTNANTNPVILDSRGEASVVTDGPTKLILKDADDNTIWTVDNVEVGDTDIIDSNGNELLKFVATLNAVNEITITNAATGNSPQIESSGSDTNVGLKIKSKGSGDLVIDGGNTGKIKLNENSTGNVEVYANTSVTGTFSASGATTLSSTVAITDDTTIGGDLAVTGSLTLTSPGTFSLIPAGCVFDYCGSSVPAGYLECDGSAISRTTYATLFAAISTVFGSGDGSTTFNLPDTRRKVRVGKGGTGTATLANTTGSTGGAETHTLTVTEIPAHTHTYTRPNYLSTYDSSLAAQGSNNSTAGVATSSTGGDGAHNNMQPSIVMMTIIKY